MLAFWQMFSRRLQSVLAGCASCLGLVAACNSDHDGLAKRDWDGGGTSAGGGGAGGASTGGAAGVSDAGSDAPVEPAGEYAFRLLNGAVDATSVSLCFRKFRRQRKAAIRISDIASGT